MNKTSSVKERESRVSDLLYFPGGKDSGRLMFFMFFILKTCFFVLFFFNSFSLTLRLAFTQSSKPLIFVTPRAEVSQHHRLARVNSFNNNGDNRPLRSDKSITLNLLLRGEINHLHYYIT